MTGAAQEMRAGTGKVSPLDMLVAREAIEARIHGLCLDLDAGDAAAAQAAFAADAGCRHGAFAGAAADYVAAAIARTLPGVSPWSWQPTSHRARAEGETAWAETYAIAADGSGDLLCGLRLLDRLAWRDGAWLIESRETVFDWALRWPDSTAAGVADASGGRSR
jgi:hypothetical protein